MTLRTRAADLDHPSLLPEARAIPTGWLRADDVVSYFVRHEDELPALLDAPFVARSPEPLDASAHHLVVADEASRTPRAHVRLRTPALRTLEPALVEQHFRRSSLPESLHRESVELSAVRIDHAKETGAGFVLLVRGIARYLVWNGAATAHGTFTVPASDEDAAIAARDAILARARIVHHESPVRARRRLARRTRCSVAHPAVPHALEAWLSLGLGLHPDAAFDPVRRRLVMLADFDLAATDRATRLAFVERGGWTTPRSTTIAVA